VFEFFHILIRLVVLSPKGGGIPAKGTSKSKLVKRIYEW